jgi:murein DD-endopeptidase MepM/ murein hydrolase activator NlpD
MNVGTKGRKVTILIVPDFEGAPHTFKVSLQLIRAGLVAAFIGLVLFTIIVVSWSGLLQKARQVDRLRTENEQFRTEQKRVAQLEARVRQLQQIESQIRRALGADDSPNNKDEIFASIIAAQTDSTEIMHRRQFTASLDQPARVVSRITDAPSFLLRRDEEIPSLWPVDGVISREFEWNSVIPKRSHPGVDIAGKEGSVIRATAAGIIVWAGWSPRYGNIVIMAHGNGYFSLYGHNQIVLVEPWDSVDRGDPIALLGNTGQSSAPHLHFEIWYQDQPLDPLELLISTL